jgi:hypothetical protein
MLIFVLPTRIFVNIHSKAILCSFTPINEAELSPFRSRSKSACREFVCRTPVVYSEFMTTAAIRIPQKRGIQDERV